MAPPRTPPRTPVGVGARPNGPPRGHLALPTLVRRDRRLDLFDELPDGLLPQGYTRSVQVASARSSSTHTHAERIACPSP